MDLSLRILKRRMQDHSKNRMSFVVIDLDKSKKYPLNFVCVMPQNKSIIKEKGSAFAEIFGERRLEIAKKLLNQAFKNEKDDEIKSEIRKLLILLEETRVISEKKMPKHKYKIEGIITEKEIRELIDSSNLSWLKALIAFLYVSGCTISEALSLKRSNIRFEENCLTVHLGFFVRYRKTVPHLIYISTNSPFINDVFLPYIEKVIEDEARIFPVTRGVLWFKLKELNLNISGDFFRRNRLTKLALRGASEAELMEWAGWQNVRYARPYMKAAGRTSARNLANLID